MRAAFACLLLLACGDSADPTGPCDPDGTATVTGSVKSASFQPITAAFQLTGSDGSVAIALAEQSTACVVPTKGQDLTILFCDAPVATRYDILRDGDFQCPIAGAFVLFEQNGGTDFASSTGGHVEITQATDACVTGTYEIDFDGETLTGDFDAVVCN